MPFLLRRAVITRILLGKIVPHSDRHWTCSNFERKCCFPPFNWNSCRHGQRFIVLYNVGFVLWIVSANAVIYFFQFSVFYLSLIKFASFSLRITLLFTEIPLFRRLAHFHRQNVCFSACLIYLFFLSWSDCHTKWVKLYPYGHFVGIT